MTSRLFIVCTLSCLTSSACASNPISDSPEVDAESAVRTVYFKTTIAAPVEKVWNTMIDAESYQQWTRPFSEGSYFEGSWDEGESIRFLSPTGDGMIAVIDENKEHQLIRIKHIGMVIQGVEDTTSAAVQEMFPAYETYHFAEVDGGTALTIEQDLDPQSEQFMKPLWTQSLSVLKEMCER